MNLMNILISLTLSTFIIGGTTQWYVFIKQSWQKAQMRKKDREIQKTLHQFVLQDLQTGGYRGGRSRDPSFPLYRHYSDYTSAYRYFRFDQVVYGFVATPGHCFGKMPATACERVQDNSHVLMIYNIPRGLTSLKYPLSDPTAALVSRSAYNIQEKSLVLISDHEQGDLFIANAIEDNTIYHKRILGLNTKDELSKLYDTRAEVVELQTVAYYLAEPERSKSSSISTSSTKRILSLFRDDFLHPAQELISGITELTFEYGTMNPGSEMKYYKPNEIKDWSKVKSVGIHLVTESYKNWEIKATLRNGYGTAHRVADVTRGFLVYHSVGE